jgi:hypothetical protein
VSKPFEEFVTYKAFSKGICHVIKSSFIDARFSYMLADKYLDSDYYDGSETKESLSKSIGSAMSYTDVEGMCVKATIESNYKLTNFLHDNYANTLNKYVENEYRLLIQKILKSKKEQLSRTVNSYQNFNMDNSDDKLLLTKLDVLNSTPAPATNLNYFIYKVSKIGRTLNVIIILFIAVFLSIIFYTITLILIDFRKQFLERKLKQEAKY